MITLIDLEDVFRTHTSELGDPADWLTMEGIDPEDLFAFVQWLSATPGGPEGGALSLAAGFCIGWATHRDLR